MDDNEIPISTNQYPPGMRFHPSDEELISFYLERKMKSLPLPPNVIIDVHLYSYDPWDLPRNSVFGEDERYFFTPRDRKYPNGRRPNRAAASGYWKATGSDQPIRSSFGSRKIGVKKGLVFYKGKPPTGHRMDWIMTEYRLPDTSRPSRSTGSMRLDDWVLCRIRQKGNMSKNEIWDEQTSSPCSSQIRKQKNLECGRDGRDMLADYLKSNEYNLIVSLLAGRDSAAGAMTLATVIPCNENGDGSRGIQSEKMDSDEPKFYSETSDQSKEQISCGNVQLHSSSMINQSGPLVATSDARSHGQHEWQGTKCKKPCISLQELDMLSALQEMFLQ